MDEGPPISMILAQGFWEGHLPTDLSQEALDVLELSAMGPPGWEELRDLAASWQERHITAEAVFHQAMSLYEGFDTAAQQAEAVRDQPESEDVRPLLHAVCEALHALAESAAAVAEASVSFHGGALSKALRSAEEAAAVLQQVYDGTHYEG